MSDGTVISARSYSDGGYQNYYSRIRSMIISSGPSPMAFVLSNKSPDINSCSGIRLFKFDPHLSSNMAVWARETISIASTSNVCSHLGLVFGRNESFLYVFSLNLGKTTLSLLDTDGNSYW